MVSSLAISIVPAVTTSPLYGRCLFSTRAKQRSTYARPLLSNIVPISGGGAPLPVYAQRYFHGDLQYRRRMSYLLDLLRNI
jgi:hypothetical protein